jgi:hypothetical protein
MVCMLCETSFAPCYNIIMEHVVGPIRIKKNTLHIWKNVNPKFCKLFFKKLIHNSYNLILCVENEDGYTYLCLICNLLLITWINYLPIGINHLKFVKRLLCKII